MPIKATDFEILRGVKADGKVALDMPRKPVRVATILDEDRLCSDMVLRHNQSVFLEDRVHDWQWIEGKFYYYTRVAVQADVLIAYAVENVPTETHKPVETEPAPRPGP